MPLDLKLMRFAHSEGHTDVCFDNKGRYLITCGSDGDVRVYDGFDDDDPESFRAGEAVTAVTYKNDQIITGADNAVQIFKFPGGSPDGIITRFTGTINHLCYSLSGNYLAAGGSDFNIKVVNVSDSSYKSLKGHEAPVLSVSFDPDEEYLASSSCDGTVKLWNWKEQKCVKTLNLLPKNNDISISKSLCRLAFQPSGKMQLAVPVANEIKIYERSSWNNIFNLKDENSSSESFSITSWSPCGGYLATASINGEILIWCIHSKNVLERTKHEKSLTITCLVWNPKTYGEIAYTDNQGQLGVCSDVIPSDLKNAVTSKKTAKTVDETDDMMVSELLINDDLDNGSDTGSLLGAKKRQRVKNCWFDEEADEDGADDEDDENTTDLAKIKAELAGPMGLEDEESNQMMEDNKSLSADANVTPVVIQQPKIIQQQPFQPGSTPVHLMHRFMVWNNVGIVRCHSEEEPSSIDIEFHDTGLHHSMHVVNHMNHTMASLSETAVLLACQANEELPSKLLCLHFGTWDRSKEWTFSMPQGEDIMAVAAASTWAAVVTNYDLLRVFTIGGIQTTVMSLPGPVVCMSAHDNQLLVVYHCGVGTPGYQCMATKLIDLDSNTQVIADQRLPLSPKASLSWLGFSLEGTPATVDSLGVVRLLNRSFDNTWTPVANTKSQVKRPSDNFWVVGLTESAEQIRCVLCTGSTYPPTLPRPLLSTLPLQLPVCEITTEKGQLEENYLRSQLLANRFEYQKQRGTPVEENSYNQSQTEIKQLLMKLFALSCKTDRDFRAKEICEFLPDAYSVSLAIKYASRNRHINLAQRLDELARRKAEEEAAAEEDVEEEEEEEEEDYYEDGRYARQPQRHYETSENPYNVVNGKRNGTTTQEAQMSDYEQDEDVEEEQMEEEEEDVEEDETPEPETVTRNSTAVLKTSAPTRPLLASSKTGQSSYGMTFSQESTRRSNPFKFSGETSKANTTAKSKGFFDSVEKQVLAKKASSKSSALEHTKKVKEGKQSTLFSNKKAKENKKPTQEKKSKDDKKENLGPKSDASSLRLKAFKCWLEEIKPFLRDENPDMSEQDIMKMAMKQWRETPDEEVQVWIKKANDEGINKQTTEQNENENLEKKRKRDEECSDKKDIEKPNEISVEEKENISKKVKTYDKQKVNSKLAGFAFNKK